MASLRIPDRYIGGLAKFLKLSDEDAEKLFASLEIGSISRTPVRKLKEVITSLSLPKGDAQNMVDAIMSIYSIWTHSYKDPASIATEMIEAIEESPAEDLQFSEEVKKRIKPRLNKLFSNHHFAVSIRADAERFEYDNVFSQASVSLDIRPIFGPVEARPEVAMFTHMLNIHYLHDGRHREFYIALDEVDIKSLMDVLENATSRVEYLKSILDEAKLTHFTPE